MTDASKIAETYIATWNETDAARRMALLARDWADGASYVDPIMSGRGHAEISALIGGVHERFPGFRFALLGEADGYDGHARFSWGWARPGGRRADQGERCRHPRRRPAEIGRRLPRPGAGGLTATGRPPRPATGRGDGIHQFH